MAKQFLIEMGNYDSVLGAQVARFATGIGYQTKKSETPSRAVYLPLVKDAGNINTFLFRNASLTGYSTAGIGQILLNGAGGSLDYLKDRGVEGFDIDVRERTGDNYPADFPIRFSGAIDSIDFTSVSTSLTIRDKTSKFRDLPYQPLKYSGDNNGTSIELEGNEDDIGGLPKPILEGKARNFTLVLVNPNKEVWQISSEPVDVIHQIYVSRATGTTQGTVRTSLAALLSNSPTAGTYDVYFGDPNAASGSNDRGCYIRMGTTPSGILTCDATAGWKNLILRSEEFANAAWSKTYTSVIANDIMSPDSKMNGSRVTKTANGFARVQQQITIETGKYYTYSICVKAGDIHHASLRVDGSSLRASVEFNLQNQTTNVTANSITDTSKLNPTIEALGDDWFRISITVDTNQANTTFFCYVDQFSATTSGYVWLYGAQVENREFAGPYTTTTTVSVYNNHVPGINWKILNRAGYNLKTGSVMRAQKQCQFQAQHYQEPSEINIGEVLNMLNDSGLFFLINDIEGNFVTGRLELPTSGESLATFTRQQILGGKGNPKIKEISSNDDDKGVPIHRYNIGYDQNYTQMNRSDLAGVADTAEELGYVKKEFRYINRDNLSVKNKFPSSPEKTKNTKFQDKADAIAQGDYEDSLFNERRPFIEIRVPIEFALRPDGQVIDLDGVITVENKLYRIVGKKSRFPAVNRNEVNTGAVTFQGWGGV